jgi:cytoskeletal protein CcmA (bactofilin family)
MFRKKDPETGAPESGEGVFRRPAGEATKPGAPSELPRRRVELSSGAAAETPPSGPSESTSRSGQTEPDRYGKRLIVGEGIRLSGEISSCDRLVVQGEVEVTLNDTLALEIASSGRFTGGCEVEEADISGVYEGDLTVRNHLCVRGTGKLTGTIRYAQLELERGGQIAGNISVLSAEGVGSSPVRRSPPPSPVVGEASAAAEAKAESK